MTRRTSRQGHRRGLRALGWLAVLCVAIVLGFMLLPGPVLQHLLASKKSRAIAESALRSELGVEGSFSSWTRTGEMIHSERFEGRGKGIRIEAEDVRGSAQLEGWPGGTLHLKSLAVRKATIAVEATSLRPNSAADPPAAAALSVPWWLRLLLPARFKMAPATIESADLLAGAAGALHGSRVTFAPEGRGLRILASEGSITSPLPGDWSACSLDLLCIDGEVRLISSNLALPAGQGTASLTGTWSQSSISHASASLHRISLEALAPALARQLTGLLEADLKATNEHGFSTWSLEGDARLLDARVTNVAALDSLAALADDDRLKTLPLETAKATIASGPNSVRLGEIVIESRGTLKIEGSLTVHANHSLDGSLQLGLSPALLARLPGAAGVVFASQRDNYLWTPVRLTGSIKAPKTDLPARMAAALPGELLRHSVEAAADPVTTTEKAARETGDLLKKSSDTLRSLLMP